MAYIIFDLDHTVIDSSHRQATLPCGSINLDHWRENCTRDKIMLDTLLPLADTMRRYYREGKHRVIVCTARVVTEHDMEFLETNGLDFHHFISRGPDDMRGDADYKVARLTEYAKTQGFSSLADMRAIMYDDNLKVIRAMLQNRVACINAIAQNERLRRKAA